MEYLRWILTVALLAWTYQTADRAGENRAIAKYQTASNAELITVNADLIKQAQDAKVQAQQQVDALLALQASMETVVKRTGVLSAQMRSAIDASDLGGCELSIDVQRLRGDGYEQARGAAASANQARDGS